MFNKNPCSDNLTFNITIVGKIFIADRAVFRCCRLYYCEADINTC